MSGDSQAEKPTEASSARSADDASVGSGKSTETNGEQVVETIDLAQAYQSETGRSGAQSLAAYTPEKRWNREREKETGARNIATVLVWTFAGSVMLVLIVAVNIISVSASPEIAARFAQTLVPLLDALTKFAAQVFLPLLAFVLGYYFGERQK